MDLYTVDSHKRVGNVGGRHCSMGWGLQMPQFYAAYTWFYARVPHKTRLNTTEQCEGSKFMAIKFWNWKWNRHSGCQPMNIIEHHEDCVHKEKECENEAKVQMWKLFRFDNDSNKNVKCHRRHIVITVTKRHRKGKEKQWAHKSTTIPTYWSNRKYEKNIFLILPYRNRIIPELRFFIAQNSFKVFESSPKIFSFFADARLNRVS